MRARRRDRTDAAALARSYADLLAPLIVVDDEDLAAGLDLYDRIHALDAFDAVLAATARRRGADALVSADTAFGRVADPHHLDPAAADFGARLARLR